MATPNLHPAMGSFRHMRSKDRLIFAASIAGDEWGLREQLLVNNTSTAKIDKRSFFQRFKDAIVDRWKSTVAMTVGLWELGRSDRRNFVFAGKSGLALTLVSLLIFVKDFEVFAKHCVWAILTVVVTFEFSIGATLSKGLNRAIGTFTAGFLALLAAEISRLFKPWDEAFIVFSIFVAAFFANFIKLYPTMKPYEYGFRVFMLTFCIVMVSGYRANQFLDTAVSRLLMIALGASVGLVVNIFIYPIWAGEDLHKLVAKNFTGLAESLEGCVTGYLNCFEYDRIPSKILTYQAHDDPLYVGYRSTVQSTSEEDNLLGFAVWEPPHGPYKMRNYPWKHYVRLSGALRHCAFMVMALHSCILSEIQAPPESRLLFSNELRNVGTEGAKVLRELGNLVKNMKKLRAENFLYQVQEAAEELQKKIDQKSYLLVSIESWEITQDHKGTKGPLDSISTVEKQSKIQAARTAKESFLDFGTPQLSRNSTFNYSLVSELDCSSSKLQLPFGSQIPWPPRQSFLDALPLEQQSKVYASASALSLATFSSLLIEFVARLTNLVDAFEELSEVAKFKEPEAEPCSGAVSFWARIKSLFGLRS